MHKLYFPACPVEGPIDPPVPFGHMATRGAIPNKCGSCGLQFEGGCVRFMDKLQRYMHLDYGPCGISGPTDPVIYEDTFIRSKVEIPRKCSRCHFLFYDNIFGFTCKKDAEKWGDCYRGLDWGAWRPERIYFNLPHPKITSQALMDAAHEDDVIAFVKEYRRVNPGTPIQEARENFSTLRKYVEEAQNGSLEPRDDRLDDL
jgi:hypothetical protein